MSGKFWDRGPMLVTGCSKVSAGCDNCWSEKAHAMRSKGPNAHVWPPDCLTDGRFNGKVHFNLDALRSAVKGKKPRVIAPWNDLYHGKVNVINIAAVFLLMMSNPQHTYLIITKRPERAVRFITDWMLSTVCQISMAELDGLSVLPDNIWHIATMENQAMVDERMPHLLNIPGKRGIIIEPMLGPVNFEAWKMESYYCDNPKHGTLCPEGIIRTDNGEVLCRYCDEPADIGYGLPFDQVILGGETGQGARPMHPDWVRSVRDQCAAAGVPFFFKSWGERVPTASGDVSNKRALVNRSEERLLDGREHNDLAWRTS